MAYEKPAITMESMNSCNGGNVPSSGSCGGGHAPRGGCYGGVGPN